MMNWNLFTYWTEKWISISRKISSPLPAEISSPSTLPPCTEARRTTEKTAASYGRLSTPLSSPKTSPSETGFCLLFWEIRPAAVSLFPPDALRLGTLLQEINWTNEKHLPGFELESIGLLHILLARLYALFPPETQTQEEMPGTDISAQRRMVAYISQHYPEKISLAGIAAAGSVSRSKCCQLFKKYMQQSPIGFLNRYRLEISRNLLDSTENSILEIANACGFSSQSYYTKMFSEKFNYTPTQYRSRLS